MSPPTRKEQSLLLVSVAELAALSLTGRTGLLKTRFWQTRFSTCSLITTTSDIDYGDYLAE